MPPVSTSEREADRLATYNAKRDFTRTPEPSGERTGVSGQNRFVVQRHRARRLHYDLRLELDGVLLSWAVPKGPTLDPSARHIAIHVEDHPLEYVDFEGIIPTGEYGGGDVVVWDRGTWHPVDEDPHTALEAGNLHFDLRGEKLAGRFVLIRPRRRDAHQDQWLLLHKKDDHAQADWVPEDHPWSVKSGRTNEEVAANPASVWHSDRPPAEAESSTVSESASPTSVELAELDALGSRGTWRFAGHDLTLTNLDKSLFPTRTGDDLTKRDLIRYYAIVAPTMVRYLVDRPVNTQRFPNGAQEPGFWQKQAPSHAPKWLRRWHYDAAETERTQWYLIPDTPAALVWLANYGAVELHPWTSSVDDVDRPTWALFDIDPGTETSFDDVLALARLHKAALDHLGMQGRPKTSGQRGIQVWVPLAPRYTYEETRAWVESVSRAIGNNMPELISWEWSKQRRGGRARLDYTQNAINKTLVAPYSVRPRPEAPVSVPLEWDELDDPALEPDGWTIRTVPERLATTGDPFAGLLGLQQTLSPL